MSRWKKHFVAVARVSSREQEREGFSLDIQVDAFRTYAKREKGRLTKVFRITETATRAQERRVFREVIEYVRTHADELDGMLFYKVDRAVRNLKDLVLLEDLGAEYGVPFISVTQPTDNTPAGRMTLRTLATMAAFFTDQQSVDVREGLQRRVESGLFSSRAPYGYRNVRIDGRGLIEIDTDNAANVRRIFTLYAYEYVSGEEIPDRLQKEGSVYTKSKERFSVSKIYGILSDQSYVGFVKFRDEWHPGTHEPLIDQETWDRTQALLGRRSYRSHCTTYGGGLVTCGHCVRKIVGEPKTKKTKLGERRYAYYRCARYSSPRHPRIRVKEEELDFQVGLSLCQMDAWCRVAVPTWLQQVAVAKMSNQSEMADDKLADLKRQRSLLTTQQDELLNMRLAGQIEAEVYERKLEFFREREGFLDEQIAVVDRTSQMPNTPAESASKIFGKIAARWADEDVTFKRRVLEIVYGEFTLAGTRLVAGNRTPFEQFQRGL